MYNEYSLLCVHVQGNVCTVNKTIKTEDSGYKENESVRESKHFVVFTIILCMHCYEFTIGCLVYSAIH